MPLCTEREGREGARQDCPGREGISSTLRSLSGLPRKGGNIRPPPLPHSPNPSSSATTTGLPSSLYCGKWDTLKSPPSLPLPSPPLFRPILQPPDCQPHTPEVASEIVLTSPTCSWRSSVW